MHTYSILVQGFSVTVIIKKLWPIRISQSFCIIEFEYCKVVGDFISSDKKKMLAMIPII